MTDREKMLDKWSGVMEGLADGATPATPADTQIAREWRLENQARFIVGGVSLSAKGVQFDWRTMDWDAMLATYAAHVLSLHRPGVPVHTADCGWTDKEEK